MSDEHKEAVEAEPNWIECPRCEGSGYEHEMDDAFRHETLCFDCDGEGGWEDQ